MNDHDLDDLIVGEPNTDKQGNKRILTLVGLILIILIVGVFLAKLIYSNPKDEAKKIQETELTGIAKPATHTASRAKKTLASAEGAIPQELQPIRKESLPASHELTPINPPAAVKTPQKPLAQEAKSQTQASTSSQAKPKPKPKAKPKTKVKTKAKAKPKPKPKTKPQAKSKAKPKAKAKTKQKAKQKDKEKKKQSPKELFEKQKSAQGKDAKNGEKRQYFIQIGSFKRDPEQKYMDNIKKHGYKPIILKNGEMIKVRLGPYNSYDEAKAKLPKIKEQLGLDGFIVRRP